MNEASLEFLLLLQVLNKIVRAILGKDALEIERNNSVESDAFAYCIERHFVIFAKHVANSLTARR